MAYSHSRIIVVVPSARVTSRLKSHFGIVILFYLQKVSEITVAELPVSIKAYTFLFSKSKSR